MRRPVARIVATLLIIFAMWAALPMPSAVAGDWVAPLPEPLTITRAFDPPDHPYGSGHRGVDLAGTPGQEVRTAGAGTVVYAGPLAGRGVVSVEHADGLRTTYEPVSAAVSAGIAVHLGQVIGALETGHLGCPVTACLHWGLKRGDLYLNPLLLLAQGPVRLLPRYGASASGTGLDPLLTMTAAPLSIGALGLLPLVRRAHRTPRRRTSSQSSSAVRSGRADCQRRSRRADGPGGRPP